MNLVTGDGLDSRKFFSRGNPGVQGSSFDLSIGKIFDDAGKELEGPFTLKPGHIVQVVSAEVFSLSNRVTGHVTYKTGLTRKGIWALTVGIVDPGWDGPIATTLLNFSRVDHTIHVGDKFLRVSLFEHEPVPDERLRKAPPLPDYLKEVQSLAASRFPTTFLDSDHIADDAAKHVLSRIRVEALAWFGLAAILFTVIQVFAPPASRVVDSRLSPSGIEDVKAELRDIKSRLIQLESSPPVAPPPQSGPAGQKAP